MVVGADDAAKLKANLICKGLEEVLGGNERVEAMLREKESPVIYWGTAITGKPHVGYLVPLAKIADFLKAGCKVKILFADLHGLLDNLKSPWELIELRTKYYEALITEVLRAMDVDLNRLEFVKGTSYQLSSEYTLDFYRLSTTTTVRNATKASAEVVKQIGCPVISSIMYPILQCLDEKYLEADAQFGGKDQRKIFALSEKIMDKKIVHLMNPMIPGLNNSKMSSSNEDSKIDLLDDPAAIKRKVGESFFDPQNCEESALLLLIKHTALHLSKYSSFTLKGDLDGEDKIFTDFDEIVQGCKGGSISALQLKNSLAHFFAELLKPVREKFNSDELQNLTNKAYPTNAVPKRGGASNLEPSVMNLKIGKVKSVEENGKMNVSFGDSSKNFVSLMPFEGENNQNDSLLNRKFVFVTNIKIKSKKISKEEENSYCEILYSPNFPGDCKAEKEIIKLIAVDEEVKEGECLNFEDFNGFPDANIDRKKVLSKLQKDLHLKNEERLLEWKGKKLCTELGETLLFSRANI